MDGGKLVLSGALSNGGEVYGWRHRSLTLPDPAATEKEFEAMPPGTHGWLLLPFFAGERSPYGRSDLRTAIAGLSLSTRPIDLLEAALESVALRVIEIYGLMKERLGRPRAVVASGGGLLRSFAWTQITTEALVLPLRHVWSQRAPAVAQRFWHWSGSALLRALAKRLQDWAPCLSTRALDSTVYRDTLSGQRMLFQKLFSES